MGITPMYVGYGADGSIWFASELKVGTTLLVFFSFMHMHQTRLQQSLKTPVSRDTCLFKRLYSMLM